MTTVDLSIRGYPVSVWQCDTAAECQKGLLGVKSLSDAKALMLPSGPNGLHTIGMSIPIDILWTDKNGNVVNVEQNVPSGLRVTKKGDFAIELAGGWLQRHPVKQAVTGCGCGDDGLTLAQAGYLMDQGAAQAKIDSLPSMFQAIAEAGGLPVTQVTSGPVRRAFQIASGPVWVDDPCCAAGCSEYVGHMVGRGNGGRSTALATRPIAQSSHGPTNPGNKVMASMVERGGNPQQNAMASILQAASAINAGGTRSDGGIFSTPSGQVTGAHGGGGGGGGRGGGGGAPRGAGRAFSGAPRGARPAPGSRSHRPSHGRRWPWWWGGSWGWGWPWWLYGYSCDPRDPSCPNYDPTIDWNWTSAYDRDTTPDEALNAMPPPAMEQAPASGAQATNPPTSPYQTILSENAGPLYNPYPQPN
jgi:uncharacterized membrane protein (UPF0127 family)